MSVISTPVYRDDPFQAMVRHIGISKDTEPILLQLLNFNVDEKVLPENPFEVGNLRDQVVGNKALLKTIANPVVKPAFKNITHLFDDKTTVLFGLQAVYRYAARFLTKIGNSGQNPDYEKLGKVTGDTYKVGSIVGQHTPKDVIDREPGLRRISQKTFIPAFEGMKCFVRMANAYSQRQYRMRQKELAYNKQAPEPIHIREKYKLPIGEYYPYPGMLLHKHNDILYVFTRNDTDRLEKILCGLGYGDFYVNTYTIMNDEDRFKVKAAFHKYRKLLVDTMQTITYDQAQLLCRCCDVAYFIVLASFASDLDELSYHDQLNKVAKEQLDKILDPRKLAAVVDGLPIRDALEVLQTYKCLPQADFDSLSALDRQYVAYQKQNKIADEFLFKQILLHHKLLMIKAYHGKHGVCPGFVEVSIENSQWQKYYPYIDPNRIDVKEVDTINFAGIFVYNDHYLDMFDLLKDKAICPVGINNIRNERALMKLQKKEKNYLLDVIHRPDVVSVAQLRDNFDNLFFDIKCEDKAEAKKPNGRLFMEAHSDVRAVLSEYEGSISEYGKYLEGFMQGKGLREKAKMMNHVTEYLPTDQDAAQVLISLDIAKWSPRLPLRVHEELDKAWANAFGMPHIERMSKIFTEGDLHYIKHNQHTKMPKSGNDFEGFAGKKLTFYHLAIMHAVVDVLKNENLIHGQTRYAAQIDDGLIRIITKTEEMAKTVEKIRKRIDQLWLAAGAEISWDKTFISSALCVFLHEVRVAGRVIPNGMRAIVKLNNHATKVAPTLLDDIQFAESTVRGAIVAGATIVTAYYLYSYLFNDAVRKWAPKDHVYKDRHIAYYFAPVNLGGLGMVNLLDMMGTFESDAFKAGVGNLYVMTFRLPKMVDVVNQILNQPMKEVSADKSVMNPMGIQREGRIVRADRMLNLVRSNLRYLLDLPMMASYGFKTGVETSKLYREIIAKTASFPAPARELWYSSTMENAIDAIATKVLNSRSVIALVSRRGLYRVTISNITEARFVIAAW